jgi:hypothetical protein
MGLREAAGVIDNTRLGLGKEKLMRRLMDAAGKNMKDRTVLSQGEPRSAPKCPGLDGVCGTFTRWRGPHPEVLVGSCGLYTPDAPVKIVNGHSVVLCIGKGEGRHRAAQRLYGVADRWVDGPSPSMLEGHSWWQPALCMGCEEDHVGMWMDAAYGEEGDDASAAPSLA